MAKTTKKKDHLFAKVIEAAPIAMIMVNKSGHIVLINQQAEKLFKFEGKQLIGFQIEALVPERFRANHPGHRMNFFANPETRPMGAGRDLYGVRSDGSEVPIEIGINPLTIDKETFVLASIIDISERKKNESLVAAREAALEASHLKSQFLASMSHEIRTPLNAILGFTDLLAETSLNIEQEDFVHGIKTSSRALLSLINDILDFSKIEAGKLDLDHTDFNLDQLVSDTLSIVSLAAENKGLEIQYEWDPKIPLWLKGDPNRIRQILLNLLSNAIKFTEKGSVSLRLKKIEIENQIDQSLILFEVKDTGPGIAKRLHKNLFEAFSQLQDSQHNSREGTGLGLSICKQLVSAMGGEIGLQSKLETGSLFWFRIPLQIGVEPIYFEKNDSFQKYSMKGKQVLVAEDNFMNQKMISKALLNMGLKVHIAKNGKEALDLIQKFKFDLILMDCYMPELDGYQTTEKIRAMSSKKMRRIPIVALTANVLKSEKERCFSVGMNDFLSKPIEIPLLRERVAYWIQKSDEDE